MLEPRRHLDGFLVGVSSVERIAALSKEPGFTRTIEYHRKVGKKLVLCGVEFFYKNKKIFQLKDLRKYLYTVFNKYKVRTIRGRPRKQCN